MTNQNNLSKEVNDPTGERLNALFEAISILNQVVPQKNILHLAAQYGKLYLLKIFASQYDINSRDEIDMEQKTALHYAIENNHFDTFCYLCQLGADLYSKDWFGRTPIHYAAQFAHHDKFVKTLIEREVNWNIQDDDGVTPLMLTSRPDIAELLVEAGGDIHAVDHDGNNLLHHAAALRDLTMVQYWWSQGVNRQQLNRQGLDPWEYFIKFDGFDIFKREQMMSHILENNDTSTGNIRRIYELLNK